MDTISNTSQGNAKSVVLKFINALNNLDFEEARSCVNDNLKFEGVMGSRNGADAYFEDMKHMQLKYSVQKAFEDGDDVCLCYDIMMSGQSIYSCGWYKIKDGRISSFKVVFDPRPLMDKKQ